MAALTSHLSFPSPNIRTPLHKITSPFNSNTTHFPFPLSNSKKRFNFSIKAEKKDSSFSSNDSTEAKKKEPNREEFDIRSNFEEILRLVSERLKFSEKKDSSSNDDLGEEDYVFGIRAFFGKRSEKFKEILGLLFERFINSEENDSFSNGDDWKEDYMNGIGWSCYDYGFVKSQRKLLEEIEELLRVMCEEDEDFKPTGELLKIAEIFRESLEPLDLLKLRDCFRHTSTFSVAAIERFPSGGGFYGKLRVPIDQALPVLEKELSEAAGQEVIVFFDKLEIWDGELATVVPKSRVDFVYRLNNFQRSYEYVIAAALSITTLWTTALMSGFFMRPDATFDYYLADVVPLFGGFLTILGVSEIATRVTAAWHGVKLGPSIPVPSVWTGCLGVINTYEPLILNNKPLFDIPVARTVSAYLTSLLLIVAAYVCHGSLNGGDNPLYIRPYFFLNNPLISILQIVLGDDLSNRLPYEVEGVGVAVDPLAFAGLLGMMVTSLNLLPCGALDGRRISNAVLGLNRGRILSYVIHFLLLSIGALSGSVLFVAWGLFTLVFQITVREVVAKDTITPLGESRYALGLFLAVICYLTLFPNAAGTFSFWSFTEPYFRGFV